MKEKEKKMSVSTTHSNPSSPNEQEDFDSIKESNPIKINIFKKIPNKRNSYEVLTELERAVQRIDDSVDFLNRRKNVL